MKNIKHKSIFFSLISLTLFATSFIPFNASAYYYVGWVDGNYIGCEANLSSMGKFIGCKEANNGNTGNQNSNTINPVPNVYSISPNSKNINTTTSSVITVSGSNFINSSVVKFNNTDRQTTYINSTTLQFQLYPSDTSTLGDASITVFNTGPGGGMSNSVIFSVKNVIAKTSTSSKTNKTTVASTSTKNISTSNVDTINDSSLSANALSANAFFSSSGFIPSTFLQWMVVLLLILFIVILWRKIYVSDRDKSAPLKHA